MKSLKKIMFSLGLVLVTSEIWKQWTLTYIINNGHYDWWYFPFQLCSIPMYLCLILPFISSEKTISMILTFLMDYSLLGAVMTFFDTTGLHFANASLTAHSYIWHVLLIGLGIASGLSKLADYSIAGYAKSTGLYLGFCLLAEFFNMLLYPMGKLNMFYISPHFRMSQKVFIHVVDQLGNSFGILFYIFMTMVGAFLIHMLWRLLLRFFR